MIAIITVITMQKKKYNTFQINKAHFLNKILYYIYFFITIKLKEHQKRQWQMAVMGAVMSFLNVKAPLNYPSSEYNEIFYHFLV